MRNVIEVHTRADLALRWQNLIERLDSIDELDIETFGELMICYGRMQRAQIPADDLLKSLMGVLARQAFPFDGDQEGDGASEWSGGVIQRREVAAVNPVHRVQSNRQRAGLIKNHLLRIVTGGASKVRGTIGDGGDIQFNHGWRGGRTSCRAS